jgi:hypothetical protein
MISLDALRRMPDRQFGWLVGAPILLVLAVVLYVLVARPWYDCHNRGGRFMRDMWSRYECINPERR